MGGLKNVINSLIPNPDSNDGNAVSIPSININLPSPEPAMVPLGKKMSHPLPYQRASIVDDNLNTKKAEIQSRNRRYSTNSTPMVANDGSNGDGNLGSSRYYRNFDPLGEVNSYPNETIVDSDSLTERDDFETKRRLYKRNFVKTNTAKASNITSESFGNDFLNEYLMERGFLKPRVVTTTNNNDLRISMAATGDHIFLPTISSSDDEYLARLHGLTEEQEIENNLNASRNANINNVNSRSEEHAQNPNTTSSDSNETEINTNVNFEIDESMFSYSIAVILSLNKTMKISDINVELCSRVRIYWNDGVPPTKTFKEEIYNVGSANWLLNNENYNLHIPLIIDETNQDKNKIIENNTFNLIKGVNKDNQKNNATNKETFFKNLEESTRTYTDKFKNKEKLLNEICNSKNQSTFSAGDYIFILPIIFTNNIPESIYLPSARVGYRLCIALKELDSSNKSQVSDLGSFNNPTYRSHQDNSSHKFNLFKKVKEQIHPKTASGGNESNTEQESKEYIYSEVPINVVRSPPPISISTANKSVYINRVWANSLSYEISFGQKYVPVNNKFPIKIKLAPLTKDIKIKRIRVSVVEKITFVSKDLEYEYDQIDIIAKDPYNPYFMEFDQKRKKERNLSLLEVRTKDRGARSIREEIIDNCIDDNILSYTAIPDDDEVPKNKKKDKEIKGFNEAITIISQLEFPKYADLDQKSAKMVPPYGVDLYAMEVNSEKELDHHHKGGVIGFFSSRRASIISKEEPVKKNDPRLQETKFQTSAENPVQHHTRVNKPKRGLYLDSLHFSNIHCRHKLEIMLRICKPDPDEPTKLRNYEVLIDIPIFLISEMCNAENLELPTYEAALNSLSLNNKSSNSSMLPTFEQAISVPGSPVGSPSLSPINCNNFDDDRYLDGLNIQQLSLSRASSISGTSQHIQNKPSNSDSTSLFKTMTVGGDSSSSRRDPRTRYSMSTKYTNLDGLLAPNSINRNNNRTASFNNPSPQNAKNVFNSNYSMNSYLDNENAIDDEAEEENETCQNDPNPNADSGSIESYTGNSTQNGPPKYNEIVYSNRHED